MNKVTLTYLRERMFYTLWEQDKPVELAFYEKEPDIKLNDILLAKVKDIVPGIRAAFVQLSPSQTAFLPLEQAPTGLRCGDELPVQITKEAQKTKDPVVTTKWSLTGRYLVLVTDKATVSVSAKIHDAKWREEIQGKLSELLDGSFGFIVRTDAYQASVEEIQSEAKAMLEDGNRIRQSAQTRACFSKLYQSESAWLSGLLGMREETEIVTDISEIYDTCKAFIDKYDLSSRLHVRFYDDPKYSMTKLYRLETILEDALRKQVWLKSGGYLVIEPTEAMVVIDVNSGKSESHKSKEEHILQLNLEAAEEVAHQLRLRNLSGMILIDFIDMRRAQHEELVMDHLRTCTKNDPVGVNVVDMTKLGIVECTRRKKERPLHEQARVSL